MLRETIVALSAVALFGGAANAQQKQTKEPGSSEYAPGQMAKKKNADPAKEYAPGQQMKEYNDPKEPGASEYAPGKQEGTSNPPNK